MTPILGGHFTGGLRLLGFITYAFIEDLTLKLCEVQRNYQQGEQIELSTRGEVQDAENMLTGNT